MRYTREHARIERNALLRARHAMRRDEIARRERAARYELKARMIEYLGGRCVRCRRTVKQIGHVVCFDFHHRDPRTKSFNFAGNYRRSWAALRAELDKCDLACAICHRLIEVEKEEAEVPRGRPPIDVAHRRGRVADEATHHFAERADASAKRLAAERVRVAREQIDLFPQHPAATRRVLGRSATAVTGQHQSTSEPRSESSRPTRTSSAVSATRTCASASTQASANPSPSAVTWAK